MEKVKIFFRKILLIHDSPKKIAGGAALGVFLGIVPGEGVMATIILSSLFRLNRLAAITAVVAFNMWTTAVILPLAALLGSFIFGIGYNNLVADFENAFSRGWKAFFTDTLIFHIALPVMVGFIIVAVLISAFFYFFIIYLLKKEKVTLTAQSGKIFDAKESAAKIKKLPKKKIINPHTKKFIKNIK